MSAKPAFEITPMRAEDYERCIEIAVAAFTTNNKMCVNLGVPGNVYRAYAAETCSKKKCVDTGLSLVARSTEDGALMAFLFLKVFDFDKPKNANKENLVMAGTTEMVEKLYEKAIDPGPPPNGLSIGSLASRKTLHCSMGGTLPIANGKGCGKALRMAAIEVCRARGFNTLLVETAHDATRHIWLKHCGGVVRAEQSTEMFVSKKGDCPLKGGDQTISVVEVVVRKARRDSAWCWPYYLVKCMVLS